MRSDRLRRDVPAGAKPNHHRHRPNLEDSGGNRGKPNLTIRTPPSNASERSHSDNELRPLTEEQRELAIKYLPMARGLAQRLYPTSPAHPEELQSTAYLALVDAARTFDPARNVGFGGFARHRIRSAIRDFQRLIVTDSSRSGLAQKPIVRRSSESGEPSGVVLAMHPTPLVKDAIDSTEAIEFWLARLPKAQAVACRLMYIDGMTQDEVAANVGCSKSYLSRLHREAITWVVREYHKANAGRSDDEQASAGAATGTAFQRMATESR